MNSYNLDKALTGIDYKDVVISYGIMEELKERDKMSEGIGNEEYITYCKTDTYERQYDDGKRIDVLRTYMRGQDEPSDKIRIILTYKEKDGTILR